MAQENHYIAIPQSNSLEDGKRVMKITKVDEPCTFLTQEEKDVIQWLNIARMYPKWFLYFRKIRNTDPIYTKTLLLTMMLMKPIEKKLIPDKKLWTGAQCHAQTSGKVNYIGHKRQDPKCKKAYNAEAIHYGGGNGAYKVERLLVDKGVPGLGHRKSILNPRYHFVGVSIQAWGTPAQSQIVVIDFAY